MSAPLESGFVFAVTNAGSEKALKREVEMAGLGWRPGYQRKGFVTFKAAEGTAFREGSLDVPLAYARRLCLSLGKFPSRGEAVKAVAAALGEGAPVQEGTFADRRMSGLPGPRAERLGEWLGTVIELGAEEFWAGAHRHGRLLSPDPAGDPGLAMPEHSPSRAWLKLEEAVRFFGIGFGKEDVVVEVGASPGGVVLALLERGASVIGVDPAKMADVVMERAVALRDAAPKSGAWFYHCRKPAALVGKKDLGNGVTWFMSDMNQSPEVVLTECARMMRMAPSIRGALMTLKLTDLMDVERKEAWFSAMKAMGFRNIRLQQFASHHRELVLLGMTADERG